MFEEPTFYAIMVIDGIGFTEKDKKYKSEAIEIRKDIDTIVKDELIEDSKVFKDFDLDGDSYTIIFKNIFTSFEVAKKIIEKIYIKNRAYQNHLKHYIRLALDYQFMDEDNKYEAIAFPTRLQKEGDKNIIIFSENFYEFLQRKEKNLKVEENAKEIDSFESKFFKYIVFENEEEIEENKKIIKTRDLELKLNIHSHLPIRDEKFTGRVEYLEEFTQKLINRESVAILSGVVGMGGVGKTALTVEICHIFKCGLRETQKKSKKLREAFENQRYFQDGILWIKFDKDLSYKETLEKVVIEQLGVELDGNFEKELKELLYKKDILIILDSAEQNEKVYKEFVSFFREFSKIVTSRINFGFDSDIKIDVMKPDEAYLLFVDILNREVNESESENINELCKKIGYLPLAIKILATRSKKKSIRIDKLIREFDETKDKVKDLKEEIFEGGEYNNLEAYSVFSLSYDDLYNSEKETFVKASIFHHSFTLDAMKFLEKNSKKGIKKLWKIFNDIENDLNKLYELSIIDKIAVKDEDNKQEIEKYSFHPLMREFAIYKLNDFKFKDRLVEAKERYYLNLVKVQDNLYFEMDEVIAVMNEIVKTNPYIYLEFALAFDEWLDSRGYWSYKVEIDKKAIAIARELGDKEKEIELLDSLGDTLEGQNKLKEAKEAFEECFIIL